MNANLLEMQMAVGPIQAALPKDETLENRIKFAMQYVRKNDSNLFWMSVPSENTLLQAALAAVMLGGSEEDKDLVQRSTLPLRMLNAAMSGIPVDFGEIELEGILPLMKWWHESAQTC